MSSETRTRFTKMVKKIGPWAGIRYLRNQQVPFEIAHEIVLGRKPRLETGFFLFRHWGL